MQNKTLLLCVFLGTLVGCKTSEDASLSMSNQWVGRTASQFFQEKGPPASSYVTEDGNTIYRWVGGETSYRRQISSSYGGMGTGGGFMREKSSSRTTSTTTEINPGTTVTTSKTTGSSFGFGITPGAVLAPAYETVHVYCEANLTVDKKDKILSIRIAGDTGGAGVSLSRCAELFP